jgi:hypothetical protein
MSDDRLPVREPAISEELQQREIKVLQGLLVSGKIDQDTFELALDELLGARTDAEFASVVRSLPPPVEFTPASRRRQEPLEISTSIGEVRLEGRWQVGRLTKISTVIAPRGLDVRQVGTSGAVSSALEQPIPGFPVVRLSATCDVGTIRLMHPKEKTTPRWGWFRRRSKSSPRP